MSKNNNHTVVSKKSKRRRSNASSRRLMITAFVICIAGIIIVANIFNSKSNEGYLAQLSTNMLTTLDIESNIITEEQEKKQLEEANELAEELEETEKNDAGTYNVESGSPYYIKVNTGANCVTIYAKDNNDNYTIPVKAMICSCGEYTPPMWKYPNSVYKLPGNKYEWLPLQEDVYGQYCTQVVGNILFHSVPYTAPYKNKLEYWEYDKLGTSASAGCIRLQVIDAKWIYDNCPEDTFVEFYSSSDPGPFGKPTAKKIFDEVNYRDWDSTDPDSSNPWRNYKEPEEEHYYEPEPDPIPTNTNKEEKKENNTTKNETKNEVNINMNTTNSTSNPISNQTKEENTIKNEINNNSIKNETIVNEVDDDEIPDEIENGI